MNKGTETVASVKASKDSEASNQLGNETGSEGGTGTAGGGRSART